MKVKKCSEKTYDFSGWATKNDIRCSDGRTIRHNAFKDMDGKKVPLVWMHDHNDPSNVLGHAILENRDEGVYAYGTFNDTEQGQNMKLLVQHGDVDAMSIWANKLQENNSGDVYHGVIREVSLVLAGANPGARIENVLRHGDFATDELVVQYRDEDGLYLSHGIDSEEDDYDEEDNYEEEEDMDGEDIQRIVDSMTEEQQEAVYALVGAAASGELDDEEDDEEDYEDDPEDEDDEEDEYDEEDEEMKHNLFDSEERESQHVLSHSEMETIFKDGKRMGSLKESFIEHAAEYGIDNIDYLFPDARNMDTTPMFISREMSWVQKVMQAVHHTPFSRIKSVFADITEDEARAKGYIKGKLKKEEVFTLLKRATTPTTVYKKQKMDKDDINDITDFDVITWLKAEMRLMLDEEIARAILIGDGRSTMSDDKISEDHIRPVYTDADLYTIKKTVDVAKDATADDKAKAFIRAAIKARKDYKGSGQPTLYTTEDMLTDMLLLTDTTGRDLYDSEAKLATKLRVKEIVCVEPMEGVSRSAMVNGESKTLPLMGIITNLADYNVGADKGGSVNMFEDFDIDYNQEKYLIETRCSGALVRPFSAITLELNVAKN